MPLSVSYHSAQLSLSSGADTGSYGINHHTWTEFSADSYAVTEAEPSAVTSTFTAPDARANPDPNVVAICRPGLRRRCVPPVLRG